MTAADAEMGDLCEVKTNGATTVAYGIAWRAEDKAKASSAKSKSVGTSETFRSAFSLPEGSHVIVSKTPVERSHAAKVVLRDCAKRESAQEINDDRRWRLRATYQLGEWFCQVRVFSDH